MRGARRPAALAACGLCWFGQHCIGSCSSAQVLRQCEAPCMPRTCWTPQPTPLPHLPPTHTLHACTATQVSLMGPWFPPSQMPIGHSENKMATIARWLPNPVLSVFQFMSMRKNAGGRQAGDQDSACAARFALHMHSRLLASALHINVRCVSPWASQYRPHLPPPPPPPRGAATAGLVSEGRLVDAMVYSSQEERQLFFSHATWEDSYNKMVLEMRRCALGGKEGQQAGAWGRRDERGPAWYPSGRGGTATNNMVLGMCRAGV